MTTNGSGNATFNLAVPVPPGLVLTATATRGSTSEFSPAFQGPAPAALRLKLGLLNRLRLDLRLALGFLW